MHRAFAGLGIKQFSKIDQISRSFVRQKNMRRLNDVDDFDIFEEESPVVLDSRAYHRRKTRKKENMH